MTSNCCRSKKQRDVLALELSVLKERLTNAYRRLATMASDETVSPRDRIEAEKACCEVAVAIVKLQSLNDQLF